MNHRRSRQISKILATTGLAWCVGVSTWIWITPIRSSGFRAEAWSTSWLAGTVFSGARTVPFEASYRFTEISLFGPLPLAVPVVMAGWATWAAWGNKRVALSLATAGLLAFCLLAGFSIGPAYVPAGGAMVWAGLALSASSRSEGRARAPADPHEGL